MAVKHRGRAKKFLAGVKRPFLERRPLGGNVGSIMTSDVTTCSTADSLQRAAQIMWDRDCGAVPVVDREGRAVGLITDRDLCMAAYTRGLPLAAMGVSSLLSSRLYVCSASTSLEDAISLMRTHRVRRLVVVDPNDRKVVGMLALADVARQLASLASSHRGASTVLSELLVSLSERRASNPTSTESTASVVHDAAE